MLKNHLKSAFRNMSKRKLLSATTIAGLALGILSSFLLLTYVFDQLSYDRYLPDSNRIYRLTSDYKGLGNFAHEKIACVYFSWVHDIKEAYPEIAQIVKFYDPSIAAATANHRTFRPNNFFISDSTFFDVFRFKFIRGKRGEALRSPMSIVLTQRIAQKYFGNTNPIGKLLTIPISDSLTLKYHITGVMQNVPANSHFHPEFVARWPRIWSSDGRGYYYILLKRGVNSKELKSRLHAFVAAHLPPEQASKFSLGMEPLTSIHLHSHLEREIEVNGNITEVDAMLILALLIITISSINYINLAIARKTASLKELGVRKVLGAGSAEIFKQNISESTVYVLASLILALLLYEPFLAALQVYVNVRIGITGLWELYLFLAFIAEIVALCAVSGAYPAFILGKMSPATIMGAGTHAAPSRNHRMRGILSRSGLVVVQFCSAIVLISSVIIVYQQMRYVAVAKLGYDAEQLVTIRNIPFQAKLRYAVLKSELRNQSGVMGVTAAVHSPSNKLVDNCQVYTGGGWQSRNAPFFHVLPVDRDFIKVMKMKLLAGNSFTKYVSAGQSVSDFNSEKKWESYFRNKNWFYIINQTGLRVLGWKTPEEAIGKRIGIHLSGLDLKYGPIVGVVKDFHFTSLHNKIGPIVMFVEPVWFDDIIIRIHARDLSNTLAGIKSVWTKVNPEFPFDYQFVSSEFAAKYAADNQFKAVMGLFSLTAIAVACIGLFAVTLSTAERRIKEIGIRKVLGASVREIMVMLTKDLTKWILLANVFAWPLAYYAMNRWLQGFAYHITMNLWLFVAAGLFTLVVAVLTVGIEAIRAASANPVESLRYE
ncbi:MAG: ABC transporter permease [Bacteroidetes bacterium]|nr:ABC transporter permease [Bacteroidota bacterium]